MASNEVKKALTVADKELQEFKQGRAAMEKFFSSNKGIIAKAVAGLLTPDRLISVALTTMTKQPELLECTKPSILQCLLTSAQLGLVPDNIMGECYLIPFNRNKGTADERKECQIIVGYRGLVELAHRSGKVKRISCHVVYEGDVFSYAYGLDEKLEHVPANKHAPVPANDKHITHVWCVIEMVNGGKQFQVMSREAVEKVRDESKNYKFSKDKPNTVWGLYFPEMAKKTVFRKTAKMVSLSPDVQRAIALEDEAEKGRQKLAFDLDLPEQETEDAMAEIINDQQEEQNMEQEAAKNAAKEKADKAAEDLKQKLNNTGKVTPR